MVSVGTPYPRPNGSWACRGELKGLQERLADIVGDNSLRALCLTVRFAGSLLTAFIQRGGRLRHPSDHPQDSFSVEAYFGTPGSSGAGDAA
jgi:hypothetical protein